LLAVGLAAQDRAAEPPARPAAKEPAALSQQEALKRFRKLSPEERLQRVEKMAGGAKTFVAVTRADLNVAVLERGTVEPADATDIVCRLKAGLIRWVIDDGTFVKKGQRLLELDDSRLQEQLRTQKIAAETALAARIVAETDLEIARTQTKLDVRTAEINRKRARLALKRFTGKDREEKEVLEGMVEVAELGLAVARLQGKSREVAAEANRKVKAGVAAEEAKRQRGIEAAIAACVIRAPQDGLVVYHIPEQTRRGPAAQQAIVAQGEAVREGQKLLRIADLKRFLVNTRIHEALIARVRVGQTATVRVDAFLLRQFRGRVKAVANVASPQDWLSADVKVYPVVVELFEQRASPLRPGMSASVRIEVERRAKVLQVPREAVVRSGRETFCYVKVGKGLQERKVTTGAANDRSTEIKDGLKEGEQVLRSPRAAAGSAVRKSSSGPAESAARVLVRSVRPPAASPTRRIRVESYGLTDKDLESIRRLPDVAAAVPVRNFPAPARGRERVSSGLVIATVPAYPELAGVRVRAGRFLDDEDDRGLRNVAVLGADVAAGLFPEESAVGKSVVVASSVYRVVGVLREQDRPAGSLAAADVNEGVYIPLGTCRVRFGSVVTVRRAGSLRREAVPLSEILVAPRSPGREPFVVTGITAVLEESHARKDWDVRALGVSRER
jgi:multidrug resistance efflux pump